MERKKDKVGAPDLRKRTDEIVRWLGLADVPDESQIDPNGLLRAKRTYVKRGDSYVDPDLEALVESVKKESVSSYIPVFSFPPFKEGVLVLAGYLAKLGLKESPVKEEESVADRVYSTDDPQVKVRVVRGGPNETSLMSVSLLINYPGETEK